MALSLAVFGSTPACTVIGNTTAVQCTSEAECLRLGPDFAGTTCDAVSKTCVKPESNVGLCTTNQECIEKFNSAPAICRKSDKKCVALTTAECPFVLQKPGNTELLDDNVIVIGAITPVNEVELGTVMQDAIALAQSEISTGFQKGLPPAPGSTATRPLVVVGCQEFGAGLEGTLRAANHLVNNVQVPIIIGPVNPSNAGIVASQVTLPARTLAILPTAISAFLNNLPNPIAPTPLLWRTNFDDVAVAAVVSEFVKTQLEPRLTEGGVTTLKIAIAADGNLLGKSSAAAINQKLRFNNKSAGQNAADGNLITVDFGDLDDTLNNPNPDARISQAIAQIRAFQPNIVLHAYATRGLIPFFIPLEQGWPSDVPRPFHIGLTPPFNTFTPLFSFLDGQPFRSGRVFGAQNYTFPVPDCDAQSTPQCHPPFPVADQRVQAWLQRFNNKFPEFNMSLTPKNQLVWLLYDATYLAAYSIVALRDKPITGENLAGTLPQFIKGNPKKVRTYAPEDIPLAFGELSAGNGIDIEGLSGTMDFDPKVAAPPYGLEITCPTLDPTSKKISGFKGSGFHIVESGQAVLTVGTTDSAPTDPITVCPPPPP